MRRQLAELGRSLFTRRLTFGCTGNLSIRGGDHILVTPTGASLGTLGPVVAGTDLAAAADAVEELEETARLHLLLRGSRTRPLSADQVAALTGRTAR
jgi:ribulose-5-phosphate 4-epimerase/fuculose-1-phosphate aldolase